MMPSASEKRIVEILGAALPGLQLVVLFGSRAHGDGQETSDHDVAVLTPRPLPVLCRFELTEALALALGTDVDLIDLRAADTVLRSRAATIERCLARVREEYGAGGEGLDADLRRQDTLVFKLLRACETTIDLAMHLVRREALGVPQSSRDAFTLLAEAGVIAPALATALQRMVGFRNLAVHRYQELDLAIVGRLVEERLVDFEAFVASALAR